MVMTHSESDKLTGIGAQRNAKHDHSDNSLEQAYKKFALAITVPAFALTLIYGASIAEPSRRLAAVMAAFLAAGAPFAVGGLLGFLFGIPRTVQDSAPATTPGAAPIVTGAKLVKDGRPASQDNTNLEQISDWLTKIIIGIGLTQLTQLPGMVQSTGEYIAGAISSQAPAMVGSLILVVFSISGFLISYLLTKLDMARELELRRQRNQ